MHVLETLKEDLNAFRDTERFEPWSWVLMAHPRFHPVLLLRLAHGCCGAGLRPIGRLFSYLNLVLFGADIGLRATIGAGLMMPHPVGIVIGEHTTVGRRVTIHQGVTLGSRGSLYEDDQQPTVGDRVQLATGAKILGGITIGAGAVVAANAVVLNDVEPDSVVGGIPAKPLGKKEATFHD